MVKRITQYTHVQRLLLAAFAVTLFGLWLGVLIRTTSVGPRATLGPVDSEGCALAELSHSGDRLVTCSLRGQQVGRWGSQIARGPVQIWDTRDGRLLHTLREDADDVLCATISPDGRHVAIVDRVLRGEVREYAEGRSVKLDWIPAAEYAQPIFGPPCLGLFDTASGTVTWIDHFEWWETHDWGAADDLRFSPDSGTLAYSTRRHGYVALWDIAMKREMLRLPGEAGPLALAPTGPLFATCRADPAERRVTVWDRTTGKHRARFGIEDGQVQRPVFSEDATMLAVARGFYLFRGSVDVTLWDIHSGKVRAEVTGLKELRTGGSGALVAQLQDASGSPSGELQFPADPYLRLLAPGAALADRTVAANARVRIHERVFEGFQPGAWFEETFLDHQAEHRPTRRFLELRDLETDIWVAKLDHTGRYLLSPDGRVLAMFGERGIQIWDLPPRRPGGLLSVLAAVPVILFTGLLWWRLGR